MNDTNTQEIVWRIENWQDITDHIESSIYKMGEDMYTFHIDPPEEFTSDMFHFTMEMIYTTFPCCIVVVVNVSTEDPNFTPPIAIKRVIFDADTVEADIMTSIPYNQIQTDLLVIKLSVSRMSKIQRSQSTPSLFYAGLCNNSSTCYLNAVLQMLYHIPAFRQLIFSIDTTEEDNGLHIILNLQRLFCQMGSSKKCTTEPLTQAFQWNEEDLKVQHDAHEFLTLFLNVLSSTIKDPQVHQKFDELFHGSILQISEDQDGKITESIEPIEFIDIPLSQCLGLDDALNRIIKEQIVDKTRTKIRRRYKELPKVLFIHLLRFSYSVERGESRKKNCRFEFPKFLNMTPYCCSSDEEQEYELFAIIVHKGNSETGHYTLLDRPTILDKWYLFDDLTVKMVTEQDAISRNFGGLQQKEIRPMKSTQLSEQQRRNSKYLRSIGKVQQNQSIGPPTAYILMYLNVKYITELMTSQSQIPFHVQQWTIPYLTSQCTSPIEFKEFGENQVPIRLLTDDLIIETISHGERNFSKISKKQLNYSKDMTVSKLYYEIAQLYRILPEEVRLWRTIDCTGAPKHVLPISEDKLETFTISDSILYFEKKKSDEPLEFEFENMRLFIIEFDPSTRGFTYTGKIIVNQNNPVVQSLPLIQELLNTSSNIDLYYENDYQHAKPIVGGQSFAEQNIHRGMILIAQVSTKVSSFDFSKPKDKYVNPLSYCDITKCPKPYALDLYFTFMFHSITVEIHSIDENKVFSLKIPFSMTYKKCAAYIAAASGFSMTSKDSMQLFYCLRPHCPSSTPVDTTMVDNVSKMFSAHQDHAVIYYKFYKNLSFEALRKSISYRVVYSSDCLRATHIHQLILKPNTLASSIPAMIGLPNDDYRYLLILNSRIVTVVDGTHKIIDDHYELRIEKSEENQFPYIRVFYGALMHKTNVIALGEPFVLSIIPNEDPEETKKRIIQNAVGLLPGENISFKCVSNINLEINDQYDLSKLEEASQQLLSLCLVINDLDYKPFIPRKKAIESLRIII